MIILIVLIAVIVVIVVIVVILMIVVIVQGVSKKRYFLDFCLISVLEVGFYFFTCDLESEFRARFI